jgi:hypothetical protein
MKKDTDIARIISIVGKVKKTEEQIGKAWKAYCKK